jgi:hypothetical protein
MTVSSLKRIIRLVTLGLLAMLSTAQAAVVTYRTGDTIRIPCVASPQPSAESMHLLVFLNETKLNVNGGWNTNDIDVKQKGNVVQVNLRSPVEVPIFVHGNNGSSYFIVVTPVGAGQSGDPEIRIVSDSSEPSDSRRSAVTEDDPVGVNGGSWETTVNLVLKLQKHIRGGRKLVSVQQRPLYNDEILRKEHKRVAGRIRKKSDDFIILEYQEWTLERVTATLMGVTYTGREPDQDFNYLDQQTDESVCIFQFPELNDPPIYALKYPKIHLLQGRERLFIYYSEKRQEIAP